MRVEQGPTFAFSLETSGGILHRAVGEVIHDGEQHTVRGRHHQLGAAGRQVQQHTRGQRHEEQDKVEIHSYVHFVYSFLRN